MQTFSVFWCIFIIVVVLSTCIMQIIDYKRTKDEETIFSEELKSLKKRYLQAFLVLGAILIWEHIERLIN